MTGATMSRASAARRSGRRRWIPALAGFGLVALVATACGSAGATASPGPGADITIMVTTAAATKYLKVVTAGPAAFKVGECITALGQANNIGAVAARTIRISQPGPNGCVTGFGRRGAPGGSPSGAAAGAAGNA